MAAAFEKGPVEVADGIWAYLQPDGGWGWSNAGLVTGGDHSLLIDTLFDLKLTDEMLRQLKRVSSSADRIGTVVNTHANGDHCFGNALFDGAEIIASQACAEEMVDVPPSRLAELMRAAPNLGSTGEFLRRIFGPFSFEGIELLPPTRTFEGELDLRVGDRTVSLIEVGPAHTRGDVVVHLPAESVVFTGDILFHGGHPIVWAGPVANWIGACEKVLELGPAVIVPGHGPLAEASAVEALRSYFEWLTSEARARYDAGMPVLDAALDIALDEYESWTERERLAVNVQALYRDFGAVELEEPLRLMATMASSLGA
ncbi:MAG TPA: MBL fold metallo-hydrolase [Acidimicrobiales bacterium]|nr:MBL fold metallo-hydrolase [Acidimicrobiales bacterium]